MSTSAPDEASRTLSWILLPGLWLVSGMARGVYAAQGVEPSARFELLVAASGLCLLWYWLLGQCAVRGRTFPMDMGMWLYVVPFVIVPYYLWRAERWRGVRKLASLAGLYLGARALSVFFEYALAASE